MYSLEHLDVSHNKISEIPVELEELTALKHFNMGYNLVSTFPGNFFKLSMYNLFWVFLRLFIVYIGYYSFYMIYIIL